MNRSLKQNRTVRLTVAIFATILISMVGLVATAAAQGKELSLADILIGLRSKKAVIDEKNKILADAVKQRGITFELTPEIEKELGTTGARPELISAIRERSPKKKDPVTEVAAKLSEPKPVVPEPVVKTAPPPPDFAFYRDRASKSIKANDFDAALIDLDKAAQFKPTESSLFADRGIIHLRREQNEAALEQFSKAIEADPKDAQSFFNRGMVKERLGKTSEALPDYEKASELNSGDEASSSSVARLKKSLADAAAAEAAKAEAARIAAERAKTPLVISVGPLNAYATRLTMPVYPAYEKRMRVQGTVTVMIGLDTNGNITSAKAIGGPKQLWNAAETAAKFSKFKPIERDGKPVVASGSIAYKFSL
ncbi:MAG: TonB family protein [Acidobacteria bacterium]|nr:TonB family protein [Acidobacteriota bacterium]MBK9529394.1 TonB family protein [Acidobacteriota bacterium]MBP7475181.1 TonB family protein [Pyrinomonadaceae bacterium]MBP9110080.1 TonB family protein [Pyrinomonadaceae bacterium]